MTTAVPTSPNLPPWLADADIVADPGLLPAEPGAYLLILDLGRPRFLDWRGGRQRLSAGRYLYAGSAYGPGGIGARVARHLRRNKESHWHIDRLTALIRQPRAIAFPGGSECDLVRRLSDTGRVTVPVPGFGSSDCGVCPSHLLLLLGE